jgi:hypothetical protein
MPHGLLFARSLKIPAAMVCHGAGVSSAHFEEWVFMTTGSKAHDD